jgi:hypothetical protein
MANSTQQAASLYDAQRNATHQTIADILAAGDDLRAELSTGSKGSSTGYYEGGSPGYYWDNSPAVNAQYDVIRNDTANLYGQATGLINGQAAGIGQGYDKKINDLTGILGPEGTAANQAAQQQIGDQQRAAAAMGISAAPQTARAQGTANLIRDNRNAFGLLNMNFLNAKRGIDLSRNASQAAAFTNANTQHQAAIQAARIKALASAKVWVPGSKGRYVQTSYTPGVKADKKTAAAIAKEQKALATSTAKEDAQRNKDSSLRQSAIQANRRLT